MLSFSEPGSKPIYVRKSRAGENALVELSTSSLSWRTPTISGFLYFQK
jgi:hypothetical protein